MRKRGRLPSPDQADAMMMTLATVSDVLVAEDNREMIKLTRSPATCATGAGDHQTNILITCRRQWTPSTVGFEPTNGLRSSARYAR